MQAVQEQVAAQVQLQAEAALQEPAQEARLLQRPEQTLPEQVQVGEPLQTNRLVVSVWQAASNLVSSLSPGIKRERRRRRGGPGRHPKATAQPGGHAAAAGEHDHTNRNIIFRIQVQLQGEVDDPLVPLCSTGNAGKAGAAAALPRGEPPGLHHLEGEVLKMLLQFENID